VLPLFFSLSDPATDFREMPWGNTWYQPLLFYIVSMVLVVAPLSEFAVRLPVAIVGGVITPILMYAVALRLFKRRGLALFSAVVLALTPPLLILSRQALDYVCPLPFILGWFWFLIDYTETRRIKSAVLGALCLGLGFYSYIASWVMMPIYFAMSAIVFWRVHPRTLRPVVAATSGFVAPLVLFIPWLWTHPEMLRETFDRYHLSDQEQVSMIQDPSNAFRLDKVAATVSAYWSYFDPGFLFLIGGPSMTTSTGRVGVFLLPLAFLLPLGVFALLRRPDPHSPAGGGAKRRSPGEAQPVCSVDRGEASTAFHALILLAVVTAPLAATLKGQPFMVQRVVFMFPFAALVATYGLEWLWDQRARAARIAAMVLLAGMALQFAVFYRDYFTHYKLRSAFYYDPAAFVDVAAYLISDEKAPLIYLSTELDDVGAKWRYYTTRDGRQDKMARTRFVDHDGLKIGPSDPGSLLAVHTKVAELAALESSGLWKIEKVISDVDNRPTVAILRKLR
jgi:4-amino-4-deoxy-L-arabinose transferase-like glycosyltransferase